MSALGSTATRSSSAGNVLPSAPLIGPRPGRAAPARQRPGLAIHPSRGSCCGDGHAAAGAHGLVAISAARVRAATRADVIKQPLCGPGCVPRGRCGARRGRVAPLCRRQVCHLAADSAADHGRLRRCADDAHARVIRAWSARDRRTDGVIRDARRGPARRGGRRSAVVAATTIATRLVPPASSHHAVDDMAPERSCPGKTVTQLVTWGSAGPATSVITTAVGAHRLGSSTRRLPTTATANPNAR